MPKNIIIIAPENDIHARVVVDELKSFEANTIHIDTADFPRVHDFDINIVPNLRDSSIRVSEKLLSFGSISGVWLRRPSPHKISSEIVQREAYAFADKSIRSAIYGGLIGYCDNFVNPFGDGEEARFKPYQLTVANKVGFKIPRTLISYNLKEIIGFKDKMDRDGLKTIYKPISTWHYGLKETRVLEEKDIESLNISAEYCSTIYQEYVEGYSDLRITVVDNDVFPAQIKFSDGRSIIDGRLDRVPIEPYKIDQVFKEKLLKMNRMLGLVYGAYDFRLTPNGEAVFMEVNPEGQYLYVEIKTGLPISHAIAKKLCNI